MSLKTNDGKLIVISGSSRCGKTAKTLQLAEKHKNVFVWDIEAQWCTQRGFKKITSLTELKKIAVTGRVGKYAFVSGGNLKAEFEQFCKCVYHFGCYFGGCAIIAEELADVTTTAKAPPSWGILCRRGLKRGITIYPISQRWAEADKTAIGNATDFYIFRQSTTSDAKYMEQKTGVDWIGISNLKPLQYIHYDTFTKKMTRSALIFKND
ncbi:MAG: hypothetical protein ABL920_10190 [Methylotenera sp.]